MFEKYIAAVIQLDTTTCYEDNLKAAADFIGEAQPMRAAQSSLPFRKTGPIRATTTLIMRKKCPEAVWPLW